MVEPKYKPGWDDIDALVEKRDRDNKDPNCGPHPSTGYARFMWIRSRWGWEIDQWAQQRRIHDTSAAWRGDDGILNVYCSCGLIVEMSPRESKARKGRSGHHNFHAPDRPVNPDFDTEFFSAPGHRDPYFGSTGPAFIARCAAEDGPSYHLWCTECGDLGEIDVLRARDGEFSRRRGNAAIDAHNAECPNTAALHEEA